MKRLQGTSYRWNNYELNEKLESIIYFSESISISEFEEISDLSYLFDDDESLSDYVAQDPDTVFFKTQYNNIELAGFISSGHKELLSSSGEIPDLTFFETTPEAIELGSDSLAWVLLPMNSPGSIFKTGSETLRYSSEKLRCFDSEFSSRYQILVDDVVISAIFIEDNIIDTIYTSTDQRGLGLGRKLAEIAKKDFPLLSHSSTFTDIGRKFINSVDLEFEEDNENSMQY